MHNGLYSSCIFVYWAYRASHMAVASMWVAAHCGSWWGTIFTFEVIASTWTKVLVSEEYSSSWPGSCHCVTEASTYRLRSFEITGRSLMATNVSVVWSLRVNVYIINSRPMRWEVELPRNPPIPPTLPRGRTYGRYSTWSPCWYGRPFKRKPMRTIWDKVQTLVYIGRMSKSTRIYGYIKKSYLWGGLRTYPRGRSPVRGVARTCHLGAGLNMFFFFFLYRLYKV